MTLILGFDTSGPYCAAALLRDGEVVALRHEAMRKGQAERLMPLLEEVLNEAGITWRDLDAIGVGTGPGNFTGIRIAVSAARGLALGLDIPAVGVDGFDARAFSSPPAHRVAIPAPRDQLYLLIETGIELRSRSEVDGPVHAEVDPADLVYAIARITANRRAETTTPPAPVYARPADAAPASDPPPRILDP
ncbi:tRNA (adenosine(37)-N6)-threonylcarbamoyltransferase complex dimerization subunit type 1 TsaB [Ruegeria sp. 2205SS24-7]|uniref:tRNA (adenosine(37)-N6)-threonylcarbamoyltransferase complex dimerization subunit type 1 TsaB n=1 Tax=Ruegeria discodermiae TaxID=3064389 RepID=UPI0027414D75|nr:tRNA (adenosine(37)-N6)-threonylcarbamoyltransferase complex dimerization subunit type 1 TsaB [Ruegeria sp. 2205SS24-7]MDP5217414.1 tRNA (adenosine(37)-N6)-threonylcarbamoyltransferase complex dimerization subunit type 1 TsaB [Ruegeria sp. 2205SS24-7]